LLVLLAKWTPRDRYRMIVGVLQDRVSLRRQIEAHGVQVICLGRPRPSILQPWRFLNYALRNIHDLVLLCKKENISIIQCHLSDAEFIGVVAGHLAGLEQIYITVHLPALLPKRPRHDPRLYLRRLAIRCCYRMATAIIAVSEEVAERLREVTGFGGKAILTIINGIDTEGPREAPGADVVRGELGLAEHDRVLVSIGRLTQQKGQIYLLEAVAILVRSYPNLKVLILGEGELRSELQAQCRRLGLRSRISFLGNREDVPQILAVAELFVLPSLYEGTSIALLEAMAAGKPIVATDIPPNRRLLAHGRNALLVPPGNGAALAAGIADLLESRQKATAFGLGARQVVRESFDVSRMLRQLERVWDGK